nr:hypothetical protein [Tanacetum cinerariifolium]
PTGRVVVRTGRAVPTGRAVLTGRAVPTGRSLRYGNAHPSVMPTWHSRWWRYHTAIQRWATALVPALPH